MLFVTFAAASLVLHLFALSCRFLPQQRRLCRLLHVSSYLFPFVFSFIAEFGSISLNSRRKFSVAVRTGGPGMGGIRSVCAPVLLVL